MIEIRQLTKRYGSFVALNDASFDIPEGQTFALLGPNGSGKTTTLKCLAGLTEPTSGDIMIKGRDIWKNAREARQHVSYLPQRVSFPESLTAREVMAFYCRLRKIPLRRIDELLEDSRFELSEFADRRVGEFSGGMVQRLAISVACLPDSPVLILDEPTVSLDPDGSIRFREYLTALKEMGRTLLFSSHVLADVEQLADRVAILVGGKVVALETIESLRYSLMHTSKMRVILRNPDPRWVEAAQQAGAQDARLEGNALLIPSNPERRWSILRTIESAGAQIDEFATKEPCLEDIYLRYVNEEKN